jgi:hypothetical protein
LLIDGYFAQGNDGRGRKSNDYAEPRTAAATESDGTGPGRLAVYVF